MIKVKALKDQYFVSSDVKLKRMAICLECPEYRLGSGRCAICGCFMKGKTKLVSAKCPENKW